MKKLKEDLPLLIPIALLLLLGGLLGGYRLYQQLTTSVQVTPPQGPVTPAATPFRALQPENEAKVAERLLAAGLNPTPVLGDTAVSGHIERLAKGETSLGRLWQYSKDLAYLNEYTAAHGGPIPTSFWDVRTPAMTANNWDEYTLVHQLAQPDSDPYLRFLTGGYGRFLQFKAAEASGEDTALDAALDMLPLAETYYATVAEKPSPRRAQELAEYANGTLMAWQSLVAGSSRTNPLTGKPMFSHSIFARNNVGTMYQYDMGQEMSISEVWGVTGFAPSLVGTPENANQVEHMSISIILQMVLGIPTTVLNGIEDEKMLAGKANQAEANADKALNNAIRQDFKPFFAGNGETAVEHFRRALKTDSSVNPDY